MLSPRTTAMARSNSPRRSSSCPDIAARTPDGACARPWGARGRDDRDDGLVATPSPYRAGPAAVRYPYCDATTLSSAPCGVYSTSIGEPLPPITDTSQTRPSVGRCTRATATGREPGRRPTTSAGSRTPASRATPVVAKGVSVDGCGAVGASRPVPSRYTYGSSLPSPVDTNRFTP